MEGIFQYQKHLMQEYVSRDMLPSFPMDLDNRESQKFIRETIGRLVEELAEAASEWDKATEVFQNQNYVDPLVRLQIIEHLPNLTEELGDVLHFFIELMIYSHVEADDMLGYYSSRLRQENLDQAFMTKDALATAMMYARHMNINSDGIREAVFNSYKFEVNELNPYYAMLHTELPTSDVIAGTKIGNDLIFIVERLMWGITQKLFMARNHLRKKAWKQQEEKTNIQAYQEGLMEA